MRQYRAIPIDKPKDSGEFVYGSLVEDEDGCWILPRDQYLTDLAYYFKDNEKYAKPYRVHPDTVGQATGRKIDDQDIYAGDIVSFFDHDFLAEVVYCPEFAAFLLDSHNENTRNNPDATMVWDCVKQKVGTIHTHPELLGDKK